MLNWIQHFLKGRNLDETYFRWIGSRKLQKTNLDVVEAWATFWIFKVSPDKTKAIISAEKKRH